MSSAASAGSTITSPKTRRFTRARVLVLGESGHLLVYRREIVQPRVLTKRMRALAAVDVRDDLASLRCPILSLAASRDALVGTACLDEIRAAQPAVIVRVVDGPHLVLQTRPTECAAVVADFLASTA